MTSRRLDPLGTRGLNRRQALAATVAATAAAAGATVLAPAAHAAPQAFPDKARTLQIIVPFAAGGGVDNAARLLADQLRKRLGLNVLVDNRAGASGTLGGKFVQTAPADGYTLLFSAATHVHAQNVLKHPPYDPQTAFQPVARVGEAPLLLVVAPNTERPTLTELLPRIRQEPDRWTAAIPAAGAPSHLATLLLEQKARLKLSYVPYKGTQPALTDVAGGHVHLLMDSMISLLPLAKAGKVKAVAISSKARSGLAPDIPTVAEAGLPGFEYVSWYGVWAPQATPAPVVKALNDAINASVADLARSGQFSQLGISPVIDSPEAFRRFIAAEVGQGAALLKAAGFQPE
ncbi:Bug family tripartite tricarboxylate transporter substrate binding protein [Ideonella livida]|uniref:Tripartite tricarboxylate transporter substrate binding protein n=1 Tax=Ideonella livida TaxID=2707176 RepID=A0A7C9PI16_9BURK|nr:tripartite tricarboxylate transporter substrate-binding protein [Ideonella livida]NDY92436.1 tripartite tricarboxylate transporter substrate binding protein [Ideonella livida]